MRGTIVWLVPLAACGSVSNDKKQDAAVQQPDMAVMADAPIDAPTPPRCDPSKAWGTPTQLANVNSPSNELAARLTSDELTVYFGSNRAGGAGQFDIYMATRTSKTADFGTPTRLMSLATDGSDSDPMPTRDGLGLLFIRSPMNNTGATDVYKATRTSTSSDFTTVTQLTSVSTSTAEETNAFLAENDNVLYITSTRPGGSGSYDVWRATKQSDGTYAQVENVTPANSGAIDAWPVGSQDGLTLYFSSNRGGGDIWRLTRPSAGASFGTATAVNELETNNNENPTWISDDNCVLYMQRDGALGLGGYDIWVAKKPL